ncbi:MAG: recombinase family protein [Candidatus Methylomirabilales bacterium]
MRAALYARVSSERQADKDLSVPSQLKAMADYASKQGWSVIEEFTDLAESARTANRPEFQRMIALAKRKPAPFEVILVWKLSRFARNREDSIIYKALLRKHSVQLVSINEPVDDSPAGRMLEGMIEVVDEFYSANLSTDTLRGMKENARRGFRNGGQAPYGYRCVKERIGNREKAKLALAPAEAPVVQRVFHLYREGLGLKEIANRLTADGARTRAGRAWSKMALHYLLRNETYTGTLLFNRHQDHAARLQGDTPEPPVRVEKAHPAIIDQESFDQAQRLLRERSPKRTHPRMLTSNYLLSGLVRCGFCGASMVGSSAKSGRFFYYGCQRVLKNGKGVCQARLVPRSKLEGAVLQQLKRRVLTEQNLTSLVGMVNEELAQATKASAGLLEETEARVVDLTERLRRLYAALETGRLTVADLAPRIKELRSQLQEQETRKAQIAAGPEDVPQVGASEVKFYVQDLQSLLETGSIMERKSFLRSFIRQVVIPENPQEDMRRGTIEYTVPLAPTGGRKSSSGNGGLSATEVLPMVRRGSPSKTRTDNHQVRQDRLALWRTSRRPLLSWVPSLVSGPLALFIRDRCLVWNRCRMQNRSEDATGSPARLQTLR